MGGVSVSRPIQSVKELWCFATDQDTNSFRVVTVLHVAVGIGMVNRNDCNVLYLSLSRSHRYEYVTRIVEQEQRCHTA